MAHFIAANCKSLFRPGNTCRHPKHQRSSWSPLGWLGVPVACVFSYIDLPNPEGGCPEQEPYPRPRGPQSFKPAPQSYAQQIIPPRGPESAP